MHLLTRSRKVRGWTPPEFARQLREHSALRGSPLGTGPDGVYRWEAGREPDRTTQQFIAELLGIASDILKQHPWPGWLAMDPLVRPYPHSWNASGAIQALVEVTGREDITMDSINRRTFVHLTGGALTTSLWSWLTADPAAAGQITHGRRLGEAAVTHIEERVRQLRREDDIDGGGQLLTETALSLRMTVRLLKDRNCTNEHGARLLAAAADFARMHAWATFDVHDTCADGTFDAALRSAHAASDPLLGSHILAFWSIAAHNSGRPADAEAMTAAALSAARGRTTPRVEAMLLSRRARTRAHQNNPACFADLDRAAELLATSTGHDDPPWIYWFDKSELLGALASTHLDMNRPDRAEETFTEAAALFPADRVRTRALFLTRRADAQCRQGELEKACATAAQALDLTEEISSYRAAGPLHELAVRMQPHESVPSVRDFRERVATLTKTSS
ncbi:XRE family transcriptional regulator [Streptomyces sp. NPDC058595]|uniref:XRE family transcriptional regulator n=1 Tax=Streptomyces sp. NPDC058595 TaxID=3346550 RepID=UPI003658CB37